VTGEFPADRSRGPDRSTTRRRLLLATAAVAGGGYAAHRLLRRPDAAFEPWTPAPGTWPLARYDPANTAHNPHARPPRDAPERRVLGSGDDPETRVRPLVGRERLVRVGAGLAGTARDGGAWTTVTEATVRAAGLGPDGRLVAAARRATDVEFAAVTYDGATPTDRVPVTGRPAWLTVGRAATYVGCVPRSLVAVRDGRVAWRAGGERTALGDGRLYAVEAPDGVVAHAERRGFDRLASAGPGRAFATGPPPGRAVHAPAVADGRLVVGAWNPLGGRAGVTAYDAATGASLWHVPLGQNATTPALAGGRGFTAVAGADGSGAVVALDLDSGETEWRDDVDWRAVAAVVGGETVVVCGAGGAGGGWVRAYEAATGTTRWTERLPVPPSPDGVALVDERILVGAGGRLYAFA
jgi:hypothetical protein